MYYYTNSNVPNIRVSVSYVSNKVNYIWISLV